jgi:ABC-type polysaccharide/polyol phosphate export permease
MRPFLLLNPFAALLTLYHTVLYDGVWPDPGILLAAAASAAAMLAIGIALFHRYEDVCSELV